MKNRTSPSNLGAVVSVRGSVVDIGFDAHLPPHLLAAARESREVAIEVLAQLDAHRVRGIALTPTQGLRPRQRGGGHGRSAEGAGRQRHSLANVRCFRECNWTATRAPADVQWRTVHRAPPALARRSTKSEIFETGIKVIDVLVPARAWRQSGPVRRSGRGQDCVAHRNDSQHDRASEGRQHFFAG